MRKKHILLTGEKRENSIPISLLLESYNYHISILKDNKNLWEKIDHYKRKNDPVDLIIFGTDFHDTQLDTFFYCEDCQDKSLPFIIISESDRFDLMSRILDSGFYGYFVNLSDPLILIEQVNTLIKNVSKYKRNEKQNFIS